MSQVVSRNAGIASVQISALIAEVSVAAAFFADTACSILIETARALAGTGRPRRVCQVQEIGVDIVHFSAESALIGRWPETFL